MRGCSAIQVKPGSLDVRKCIDALDSQSQLSANALGES
jgi:hypothetical protein